MLRRYPIYGRAALVVCVVVAPVVVLPSATGPFGMVKVTAAWVCGLTACALWATWSAERRAWLPRTRLGYAVAAFLAASTLATALSLSPAYSLIGNYGREGGLIPLLLYGAIMFAIIGLYWEHPHRLRQLAWASAGGALVLACSILLQQAAIDRTLWPGPFEGTSHDYPGGTMGHSNFAGAYVGIALPAFAYLALTAYTRRWRAALGAAAGIDVLALWYTQSRGGMVAAAVGLGAMALASGGRAARWAKLVLGLGVVLSLVVVVVVAWHPGMERPPERLAGVSVLRTKTLGIRTELWATAGRAFLRNPVVGTGLDTFYANHPRYRSDPGADLATIDKPHNIFLERASDAGLLGASTYLALVGLGLWYGFRRCRHLDRHARLLLASFVGMLSGYLAQGFFSIDVHPLPLIGWVALGAIAAVADPGVVSARTRREGVGRDASAVAGPPPEPEVAGRGPDAKEAVRWPVHALVGTVLVVLVAAGLRPLRADVKVHSRLVDQAASLNPLESRYRAWAGDAAMARASRTRDEQTRVALLRQGRDRYLEALRLQPGERSYLVALAELETAWAAIDPRRFAEAEHRWQRAIGSHPPSEAVRAAVDSALAAAKSRALLRLQLASRTRGDDPTVWTRLASAYAAVDDHDKATMAVARAKALEATEGRGPATPAGPPR